MQKRPEDGTQKKQRIKEKLRCITVEKEFTKQITFATIDGLWLHIDWEHRLIRNSSIQNRKAARKNTDKDTEA
jgi:hypothetical protein